MSTGPGGPGRPGNDLGFEMDLENLEMTWDFDIFLMMTWNFLFLIKLVNNVAKSENMVAS